MGLFGKLFGSKSNDNFNELYEKMKSCADKLHSFRSDNVSCISNAGDYLEAYKQFIELSEQIDVNEFNRTVIREAAAADPGSMFPYHPVFKISILDKKENTLSKISQGLERITNTVKSRSNGLETFNSRYKNIPEHEIMLSDDPINRNSLEEMPEIKYANITKSFNKQKLISFVVLDTETTGLKASTGKIIQLSAVKYIEWEPVEFWNSYINPQKKVPKSATEINGITNEMLTGKPAINQVAKSFLDFVGKNDVVGYNLPFDMSFLFAEGLDLTTQKRKYYDVLALARKVYKKDLEYFRLVDVADYQGIVFDAHNSLNDCFATGEVFTNLVDDLIY